MTDDIIRDYGYLALGTRLRRIGERLQADVQALIEAHGLPIQAHHYPILYAIDDNGPLEIGQLARILGVSQPGVTRSIGQLDAAGCVTVATSQSDKRVRRVDLTEMGRRILSTGRSSIQPRVVGALEKIFEDDPRLLPLLDRLEDTLGNATLADLSAPPDSDRRHG